MIGGVVASAGVIIVGLQIGAGVGAAQTTTTPASNSGGTASGGSTSATTPPPSATSPAPPRSGSSSPKDGSFRGITVQTPYGPMQVAAVMSGGKITDVKVLQETNYGGLSGQIDNQADPMLHQEVLQAQSANVSMIGGATYTSQGYLQSLQAALDKAGFTG
jgi:uncharacterized protein with FMN-binding domain